MLPLIAQIGSEIYSAEQAKRGQEKANSRAAEMMDSQNAFSALQAQMQRDWEERMFKNRYQYSRADLEAAGYNPLIAVGGSPSVPGGASASPVSVPPVHSATESASRITAGTMSNVSQRLTEAIMRDKLSAEATSAKAHAEIDKMDADSYKSMPFLSKIKTVLNSVPGLGQIAGGLGIGALLRGNLSSAKGVNANITRGFKLRGRG